MEEVRFLVREIQGPVRIAAGMPYNIRTMSIKALKDAGVARVSLPALAILSAVRAMTDVWRSVQGTEDFADILSKNQVCGMEDIAALLKRV
jgi:2-methylisocitrate lyase-like PEP mutase family enzyme